MQRRLEATRRFLTIAAAVLFIALGFWLIFDPLAVESMYPISLNEPMAISEIRAVFGGMMLGVGAAVLALDLIFKRAREAAMVLAMITAGLVVARVVGFAYEGSPSGVVLNEVIFEVVLLGALVVTGAFRRERLR